MCFENQSGPEAQQSKEIDRVLEDDRKKIINTFKLLLLGPGESGKSTFFKQLKIINLNGYTEQEREQNKEFVYFNILNNLLSLIAAAEKFGVPLADANQELVENFVTIDMTTSWKENDFIPLVKDIKRLWKDPGVQAVFERKSEYQLNDSTEYFFDNIDRIGYQDYIPTLEDILRLRVKTTGIREMPIPVGKQVIVVVDVGGQRSERRKWIHCFAGVTAIIFFAAISEYDQMLAEDEQANRMKDSLKLFKDVANYKVFAETPIILFLNKIDIFKQKITKAPLTNLFPDYQGSTDWVVASDFIVDKFKGQAPTKRIYVHKTTAIDTTNMKVVFKAVKDIFLQSDLNQIGI